MAGAKASDCIQVNKELLAFIRKHYAIDSNITEKNRTLEQKLTQADVVFLGETHHDPLHQKWNGKIINALWTEDTQLLVEHRPVGSQEQLSGVRAEIASKAKQWDRGKSGTAALFDKLAKLSTMIPKDFKKIPFPEADVEKDLAKATKELIKRGTHLIENYITQTLAVEEAWAIIDGQIADILDEAEEESRSYDRIRLMFKQAYLRVWVLAAQQTLDRFLIELEGEMVERNSCMTHMIAEGLKEHNRVLLVAGSDHFNELLTDAQMKQVKNPVFTYLHQMNMRYAILIPLNDEAREMSKRILHIADADTDKIENHALNLVYQLRELKENEQNDDDFDTSGYSDHFHDSVKQVAELKELCLEAIRDVNIQAHEQAQAFHYSTGAICLRVHDLAKTIQLWNVIVELALADPDQKTGFSELIFAKDRT